MHQILRGFQSTLPVKGATIYKVICVVTVCISIHAPREGSDVYDTAGRIEMYEFQSTLPVKGATILKLRQVRRMANFNPRSP